MYQYIHETPKASQNAPVKKHYDVVVVGGGMSSRNSSAASLPMRYSAPEK